jgi:hypothetical protein
MSEKIMLEGELSSRKKWQDVVNPTGDENLVLEIESYSDPS